MFLPSAVAVYMINTCFWAFLLVKLWAYTKFCFSSACDFPFFSNSFFDSSSGMIFSPLKTIRKILFHPCILAPTTLQADNLITVEETLGIEHYKKYIVVWNIWGFHSILNKIDVYSLGSFFSPAGISLWIKVYLITACTMEILGRNVCPRLVKSRGTATSSWNLEIVYCSYCRRGWIF